MRRSALAVAVLLVARVAAGATSAQTASGDEKVRLYTNADLVGLPPIPTSAPTPASDELGWEFVIDFLAEQHARIDAQRTNDLDRAFVEATARRPRESSPRYPLPLRYAPWLDPYRAPHTARRPSTVPAPTRGPRDWIVPLHARPARRPS